VPPETIPLRPAAGGQGESPAALALHLTAAALEPIIVKAVEATLARLEEGRERLDEKMAYSEAEAARLLSLHTHQLRDARRRGEIGHSLGPGKRILYSRQDLAAYLLARRG
jgi:hypothetical protein